MKERRGNDSVVNKWFAKDKEKRRIHMKESVYKSYDELPLFINSANAAIIALVIVSAVRLGILTAI